MTSKELVDTLHWENPFQRREWRGQIISVDGTLATEFSSDDLEEIIIAKHSGPGWDGKSAGIVRLKDGRFVGWDSWWDCTGSGFGADAYGGTENIFVGATLKAVLWFGIGAEGRVLLGYPAESNLGT